MDVINTLASKLATLPEPGKVVTGPDTLGLRTAILSPLDLGVLAEHLGHDEGANVHANAVVQVGLPADRLLVERFPAHEDIVGGLAFEDERELLLKFLRCGETVLGASFARLHALPLARNPVTEGG